MEIIKKAIGGDNSTEYVIDKFNKIDDLTELANIVKNSNDRLFISWATTADVDSANEVIDIDELINQQDSFINERYPVILDTHQPVPVGRVLSYKVKTHPMSGSKGILYLCKVYSGHRSDDFFWDAITNGVYKGLSIGGLFNSSKSVYNYSTGIRKVKGVQQNEVSICQTATNPYANFVSYSVLAKGGKSRLFNKSDFNNFFSIFNVRQLIRNFNNISNSIIRKTNIPPGAINLTHNEPIPEGYREFIGPKGGKYAVKIGSKGKTEEDEKKKQPSKNLESIDEKMLFEQPGLWLRGKSTAINTLLRNGDVRIEHYAEILDEQIKIGGIKLTEPVTRTLNKTRINSIVKNDIIIDKAYMFASRKNLFSEGKDIYTLEIITNGLKVLPVDKDSDSIIIPRNTRFEIKKHNKNEKKMLIEYMGK